VSKGDIRSQLPNLWKDGERWWSDLQKSTELRMKEIKQRGYKWGAEGKGLEGDIGRSRS
jgi:hypothetical protein